MSQQGHCPPASVDHVWANARVLLPSGRAATACQLGGDHLGPYLAELAGSAVVVGPGTRPGPGWGAVAARADRTPFPDSAFDLVAVEDLGATGCSAGHVLEEARRLCRPAGSIVVGFRAGLGRLRSPAFPWSDHGVVLVVLPSLRRPAFLLRPGDRDVARYFVRRVAFAYRPPGGSNNGARMRQARTRAALAAPAALAVRGAPGRLAVLPGPATPASLLGGVSELVRASWKDFRLPGQPPRRLAPLVVGHRRPTTGMATVLLFRDGDRAPSVVAKLPRYGHTRAPLRSEAEMLEAVRRGLDGGVRDAIPRSLGLHAVDGTDVLLQTGMPGRHLVAEVARRRPRPASVGRQLDLVLAWCLDLQAASGRPETVDESLLAGKLEAPARACLAALGGDPEVGRLLDRTLAGARELRGTELPLVTCHGDYWAGNVLIERGQVCGVVDWERAALDELPFWDLVKAVGSAAYHLDRHRSLARRGPAVLPGWGDLGPWAGLGDPRFSTGFRAAFVQPGWLADTARRALIIAFHRAGIPLGWLPVAVTMYLVRQVTHAADSPRSVAGWGSVLRALAAVPGTWADELSAGRTRATLVPRLAPEAHLDDERIKGPGRG
jgi:phosphotransferase family enzyme